jgi:accessory gene regulator B
MNNLINSLVEKISISNPEFSDLELKKMTYGMECFFDEITKFVPYFIIFWMLSLHKYFLISILFFCPIRLFSGGYHAKTYWGCFFISFIIFASIILFGKYIILNSISKILLLGISLILIWIFSPVDNVNKRIKSSQRRLMLNRVSVVITICLCILCYIIPNEFTATAVISIFSASVMMIIGKFI